MAGDENVTIRVNISVHFSHNAEYDETFEGPPRPVWDAMTKKEREAYLEDAAETALNNQVESYAEVVED